jgi:hypothetical protein
VFGARKYIGFMNGHGVTHKVEVGRSSVGDLLGLAGEQSDVHSLVISSIIGLVTVSTV